MKYVCLVYGDGAAFDGLPEDEQVARQVRPRRETGERTPGRQ
jgi:hypothetical protein